MTGNNKKTEYMDDPYDLRGRGVNLETNQQHYSPYADNF
jgi:hypothetical protein